MTMSFPKSSSVQGIIYASDYVIQLKCIFQEFPTEDMCSDVGCELIFIFIMVNKCKISLRLLEIL